MSRLSANISLTKENLSPLSFEDVPRHAYTEAVLGVYELNKTELLRDIFIWAFERSADRYVAVRQSLGEPDPFRLQHRAALRGVIGAVVRECMDKRRAATHVKTWAQEHIDSGARERFREVAESELAALHEGNFARSDQTVRARSMVGGLGNVRSSVPVGASPPWAASGLEMSGSAANDLNGVALLRTARDKQAQSPGTLKTVFSTPTITAYGS